MAFVLDASVALCWFLPGQESLQSSALLKRPKLEGVLVPPLWHIEVANRLGLKLRRGIISHDEITFATDLTGVLNLATSPFVWKSTAEVVLIMNQYALTAYDATYLFLAMTRDLPLATFDKELIAAAPQAGVALVA